MGTMLYHGTVVPGLDTIKATAKSHATGMPVAYFTEDRCYALVCCRNRNENFVTMGIRADGKQHYFERFPNQLEVLYKGKRGHLYCLESTDGLTHTKGHTWESAQDVPVAKCEIIADVYEEILREEAKGDLVIHIYSEIDPSEQKMHANHIRDHILEEGTEMAQFYYAHFSSLWDSKDS